MASKFCAAVDRGVSDGVSGTGAVYGVGRSPAAAVRDARRWGGDATSVYDVVDCTPAAYAYVRTHGGAPSPEVSAGRTGVSLRSEE